MPVALVFPLLLYAYDVKDKDDLQPTDSLLHDTGASQLSVKQLIVPASLMAYGIFEAAMMHGNRMLNYSIGHEAITHKPAKFRIDDYMQYVPAASVYVLNLAGGKGRHGFKDRTVILVMASLFTAVTVNELKYTVREQRPDKSGRNSFPSGITNNQVQVITQTPSLGAQEVEQFITTPVEMALANIPRVTERRSISRSGLSVITLVFDDAADVYWARQQVSQQLKEAEEVLPQGKGTVGLAPVTTGLGEIYHYTIRAEKGYEDKYSLTDLRTMQDWIVRKQLSGTEGIAEVSGWGGYVKQYEVAIDADRLNASGLTVADVYDALEAGNENTGGSYIEKNSNQYFIRGIGLARSFEDIGKIPVKTIGGTPILVRDVANVQFGYATRYGAVTRNGEG